MRSANANSVPPLPTDDDLALDEGARLFTLQLHFNLFPASYVDPSWLPKSAASEADLTVGGSPFWMRSLSSALLREWQLEQQFDCDFRDPAKRLALLDAVLLLRVGGLASAALLRERIRRTVDGASLAVMQRAIGIEAHRFALRWREDLGELAEIATLWNRKLDRDWPTADEWAAHSASLVMAAMPATASGVIGRLRLKFPRAWSSEPRERVRMSERQRAALAKFLIDRVSEFSSEWGEVLALPKSARNAVGS